MAPSWTRTSSLGLEQGILSVGRNARWGKTGECEPVNAALGVVGSHWGTFSRQWHYHFCDFSFFSLLKGLLTAGLWQLKTSEKRLSEVKCTGHFDGCAPLMLQLSGEVTCVTATRMAGEWSLQTLFQGEERGQTCQNLLARVRGLLPEDWERRPFTISKGPKPPQWSQSVLAPDMRLASKA